MNRTLLGIAMALLLAAPLAADDSRDTAKIRGERAIDSFHRAVIGCGARPPFKPTIALADRPGIIHYDEQTGQVVLYPWAVVDAATKEDFAQQAKAAGQTDGGREAYEVIFHEVLVAHELGHWLQSFQPELRTPAGIYDGWSAEYNANQIMLAFLRDESGQSRKQIDRIAAYLSSEASKPNAAPPPSGTSLEDYFNTERMTIVRAGAYGWYQGEMTQRALAERPEPRFCDLVARWLPLN